MLFLCVLQHDELLRSALEAGAEARRAGGNVAGAAGGAEGGPGPAALWVVGNGHGSPCIDFRRVSAELAAAAEGADLLVLEGMGRALHTNFNTRFKCEVVKVSTAAPRWSFLARRARRPGRMLCFIEPQWLNCTVLHHLAGCTIAQVFPLTSRKGSQVSEICDKVSDNHAGRETNVP